MSTTISKWFILFIGAVILQTTLMPTISIGGIMPDLVLIVLFLVSHRYGMMTGIFAGFITGLFMDVYSPSLLGQNALAKTITGAAFGIFNERVMRVDPVLKVLILIIGLFIHDAFFSGSASIILKTPLSAVFEELLTRSFPRSFYTVIMLLIVNSWNSFVKPNLIR